MAVLVEAISVIIRRDAIDTKFIGGWKAFTESIPNSTFCTDDQLVRVGFMTPRDIQSYINYLENNGLQFMSEGKAIDIAVLDQQKGPTTNCEWLKFGKLIMGENGSVSACFLFDSQKQENESQSQNNALRLAIPANWDYEHSLSKKFNFVPLNQVNNRMKFLGSENGLDSFLDLDTGKVVYVGRPNDLPLLPDKKRG